MERKISTSLYALAFFLTVIVFSAGVLVGKLVDQTNQNLISEEVDDLTQKLESAQLLMLLDEESSAFCPLYRTQLDSINKDVENIGYKLTYLEQEKSAYDEPLKRSYFILEAQSYLLTKKLNDRCGENTTMIIFFYSNEGCPECLTMGDDILLVRDEIAGEVDGMRIYSFDGRLGSPIADGLASSFNVTTYPSLVVNGKLFPGSMDQEQIKAAIRGS